MKIHLLFLLAISVQAHGFSYKLNNDKNLSAGDRVKVAAIFEETQKLLPENLKSAIPDVLVEFSGEDTQIIIACDGTQAKATKFLGKTTNILGKKQISLNKAFLNHITLGPKDKIEYPCKHKNYFKEAIATLAHETAHVYEMASDGRPSKSKVFRNNVFFNKNTLTERSADPYEFSSYSESYAVNFEYFLMDPDFKCRKPSLYSFYADEFDQLPFQEIECNKTIKAKISARSAYADFDIKRLYQIDYFLAGPGKALMSRFGHSMIRLVFCSPESKFGPDCLKDVSHHFILSFRANTGNSGSNYMYGMIGKFPSQLFVVPFSKVVDEYNRDEFRSLFAFPLKLTKDQKKKFLDHALESHWSYSGKYYFTHNNCAVETKQLISAVLDEDHSFRKTKSPTPGDLKMDLFEHGLIDDPKLVKDHPSTLYFPSKYKEELAIALEKVLPYINRPMDKLEDYLEETTAHEREEWFKKVSKDRKVQMSFYMLEQNILKRVNNKFGDAMNKLYKSKHIKPEDKVTIDQYLKLQSDLSPWFALKNKAYGIPLEDEIDQKAAFEAHKKFFSGNETLVTVLRKYDETLVSDFLKTQENSKNFFWLK